MDRKDSSKFLKQLLDKCESINETLHLWSQVADFYKDNPDYDGPSDTSKGIKKDLEKMLESLEEKADYCVEILDWIECMIEEFKEQIGSFDVMNYDYEDNDIITVDEAMKLHRKLYSEDYQDDI